MNDSNENDDSKISIAFDAYDSAVAGVRSQTRFKFIPETHLNSQTVAGIRDMNLGRIKDGKPIGKPVVRFDTGIPSASKLRNLKPGQPIPPSKPHINIDPKGFSSAKNPHIYVNETVIECAQGFQTFCKYAGPALTVAAVAVEAWRLKSAFSDDLEIKNNKDEIIKELRDAIRQLKNDLKTETDETKKLIEKKLEEYRKCLKEMKRNFSKKVKKGAEIVGGWTGGFAAGTAGSSAGFQIGATVGTFVGPAGTVVGGIAGALIGAIGAGIAGGYGGTCAAGYLAEKGMEYFDSDDEDEDDEEDENENEKNKDDADEEDKKENEDDERKKYI